MTPPPAKPDAWSRTIAPDGSDALDGLGATSSVGAQVLEDVERYLSRFVAYPSEGAKVASVLWAAHAHAVDAFESTPRIAYLSPEPGSGKSRALEVLTPLVPAAMHAVNATPAALFRSVSDLEHRPTILFDEIDTVFGPKAKENEEVRGFLNAGHRRGAVAYRCVGEGTRQRVVAFPAFCAVALAGLNDLPDTIATRSVIVRMRRRSPDEVVEPYRFRRHERIGRDLAERLGPWIASVMRELEAAEPDMPHGVVDRTADVWEPLLAIADAAGGEWPDRARVACLELTTQARDAEPSLGVRLLSDLRDAWIAAGDQDHAHTDMILEGLHALEESPWRDLRGRPLDARGLARFLRRYGILSTSVRVGDRAAKGYRRADLVDAWGRYLPPLSPLPNKGHKGHEGHPPHDPVTFRGHGVTLATSSVTLVETGSPHGCDLVTHVTPIRGEHLRADSGAGVAGVAGVDCAASPDAETACPHGMAGGDQPDLFVGGALACPACRRDTA